MTCLVISMLLLLIEELQSAVEQCLHGDSCVSDCVITVSVQVDSYQ